MNNMNLLNRQIFQNYLESKRNCSSKQIKYKNGLILNFNSDDIFNIVFFDNNKNFKEKREESKNIEECSSKILKTENKKIKCKTFYEKGYCPLGSKCKYQHDERKFKDISFSYFYLRLFLLKNFGYRFSKYNYNEKKSKLFTKRLSVFESLTKDYNNSNNSNKNKEEEKYDSSCDNFYNNDIIVNFS